MANKKGKRAKDVEAAKLAKNIKKLPLIETCRTSETVKGFNVKIC